MIDISAPRLSHAETPEGYCNRRKRRALEACYRMPPGDQRTRAVARVLVETPGAETPALSAARDWLRWRGLSDKRRGESRPRVAPVTRAQMDAARWLHRRSGQ